MAKATAANSTPTTWTTEAVQGVLSWLARIDEDTQKRKNLAQWPKGVKNVAAKKIITTEPAVGALANITAVKLATKVSALSRT
jgi:hypothetical protein